MDQQPPPEFQQVDAIYGPPIAQHQPEQHHLAEQELVAEGGQQMPAEEAKLNQQELQRIDERQELEEGSE